MMNENLRLGLEWQAAYNKRLEGYRKGAIEYFEAEGEDVSNLTTLDDLERLFSDRIADREFDDTPQDTTYIVAEVKEWARRLHWREHGKWPNVKLIDDDLNVYVHVTDQWTGETLYVSLAVQDGRLLHFEPVSTPEANLLLASALFADDSAILPDGDLIVFGHNH